MGLDPFLGEIELFAGNFAPQGWALCNGQLMSIAQNTALFSILGTTYGGNGTTTFALPNLQSRTAIHWGNGPGLSPVVLGEQSGAENVTLNVSQLPSHNHTVKVNSDNSNMTATTAGNYLSGKTESGESVVSTGANAGTLTTLNPATVSAAGGNQPISIRSPYLAVTFIIALQGIYPSRN